jgi:hypothetical protein
MTQGISTRIQSNQHFAHHVRRRLEERHHQTTPLRRMLAHLTDDELIETYLNNEKQGRDHAAKRRAEKSEAQ